MRRALLIAIACLGFSACGDNSEPNPEVCDDLLDNDMDDAIDCLDTDCAAAANCVSSENICNDTLDNDSDGQTDCADSDCAAAVNCTPETACNDTMDNDQDGQTDCADTDCAGAVNCIPEADCDDGVDNDVDTFIDCADTDCATAVNCVPETLCMDTLDNDLDTLIDCLDPDCVAAPNCNPEGDCFNTVDDDFDGMTDCADSDCTAACATGCPVGQTAILVSATDVPLMFGVTNTASNIAVATTGVVTGVAVGLDVTHAFDADVELRLESPNGTIADLSIGNGGGAANYTDTFFTDTAAMSITAGTAPFTGSFQPEEPFSTFDSGPASGTWILHADDNFPTADDGTLDSVDLYLCVCNGTAGCEFGLACRDGVDNDGDTLVDCADTADCAAAPNCLPETICNDSLDNDFDTNTDCADSDCGGVGICEFGTEVTCNDSLDNDGDGAVDCADTNCATTPYCTTEVNCANGLDDDGDGLADCLDPGCNGMAGCEFGNEVSCTDGIDNDGDGAADCADTTCSPQLTCAIPTCPAGMTKTIYTSTDVPVAISDNSTSTSTITVPDSGLVADVAVRIDITHTFDGDLDISLVAPGGTNDLSSDNGGSGENYVNTRFVDSATTAITAGSAPFTGLFRPEQPLSTHYGAPLAGDWDLSVADDAGGDVGSLTGYAILVCSCDGTTNICEFGEACRDAVDNDGDGLIDCAEPACGADPFCIPETACADGLDNDFDGLVDCDDPNCNGLNNCEFGTELSCADAFDNDSDGPVDCADADCDPACPPAVCGDGVITFPETCDDANANGGDGCSPTCMPEPGYSCAGIPSTCAVNEVEPNGTASEASASPVQVTDTTRIRGTIPAAGDLDFYQVTVNTSTVLRMETFVGTVGNCVPSTTLTVRLRDAAGTTIVSDSAGGIGNCAALVYFVTPGTYFVQVEETGNNAAVPAYFLEVSFAADQGAEAEPPAMMGINDTNATASPNFLGTFNSWTFGDHSLTTDTDVWSITVPAGGRIRAEVIEGDLAAETCEANNVDSRLTLFDATGAQLTDDDDDGRGFCSKIDGTGTTPLDVGARNSTALEQVMFLHVRQSTFAAGTEGIFVYRLQVTIR